MGEPELRAFLLYVLQEKRVAPSTLGTYVASLKFLYSVTLGRPEVAALLPYPKVPHTLPDILSFQEVTALLDALGSIRYRAVVTRQGAAVAGGGAHADPSAAGIGR